MNELRNKNYDRVILVIKSEEEWNKLQKANVSDNILIPFFYADKIAVIPNNTNIFVYGEDEPCYTQNKLILRKRTQKNIIDRLDFPVVAKFLSMRVCIRKKDITDLRMRSQL